MRIVVGSDHAGYKLKEAIKKFLTERYIEVIDVGTHSEDSCDYPDYAAKAIETYRVEELDGGILICGTGIGMSIAANKHRGIRAALAYNPETAELCKRHNHANFLCLGGRTTDIDLALKIVDKWLNTSPEMGRHLRRINKITELEKRECR
jgi:ribose 5-phosphate isomerase B